MNLSDDACVRAVQAVAKCGVDLAKIASVEIVGSATRTPALVKTTEEVFQKVCDRLQPSRPELVAKGAYR